MGDVPPGYLNPWSEGDARTGTHAQACDRGCGSYLSDRCWCHGVRHHLDGSERADIEDVPGTSRKLSPDLGSEAP